MAHHVAWRSQTRLLPSDVGVQTHEMVCRTLETMGCYDQINLYSSAAAETHCRQLQLVEVEEKHRDRLLQQQGLADQTDDSHLFLGGQGTRGGCCVCPELQSWIAEQLQKESAVLKERRKAREERQLARPKGKASPAPSS